MKTREQSLFSLAWSGLEYQRFGANIKRDREEKRKVAANEGVSRKRPPSSWWNDSGTVTLMGLPTFLRAGLLLQPWPSLAECVQGLA